MRTWIIGVHNGRRHIVTATVKANEAPVTVDGAWLVQADEYTMQDQGLTALDLFDDMRRDGTLTDLTGLPEVPEDDEPRDANPMTVAQLRDRLSHIDGDVKVNLVVGNDDWDAYSGWEPELFSWEEGQEYVILFGHEDRNATNDPHPARIGS